MKVVQWNCNKMTVNRCEELNLLIKEIDPDIICLNEVKLDQHRANYQLSFENYETIYKPRLANSNHGGGVAIIIKNKLDYCETNIFSSLKLEIVEVKIKLKNKEVLICAYYNPPNEKLNEVVFRTLSNTNINYILCGDLNANTKIIGCTIENENGKSLERILSDYNCQIINTREHTFHRTYNNYSNK